MCSPHPHNCPALGQGLAVPWPAQGLLPLLGPLHPTWRKISPTFLSLPQPGRYSVGHRAAGTALCCGGGSEQADERWSRHKSARSQLGEDENGVCSCTALEGQGARAKRVRKQGGQWGADTFLAAPALMALGRGCVYPRGWVICLLQ